MQCLEHDEIGNGFFRHRSAPPVVTQRHGDVNNFGQSLNDHKKGALCFLMSSEALAIAEFCTVLSDQELERMHRFRFRCDRQLYAAAHWLKRTVIGALTGRDPHRLAFSVNPFGKPALREFNLNFNISHSGNHVALLSAWDGQVGVDVEFPRPDWDYKSVLPYVAHQREYKGITDADDFYRLWTLKEAVCKVNGKGLSLEPRSFELVPVDAGGFTAYCDHRTWIAWLHQIYSGGYLACAFEAPPRHLWIINVGQKN
jgi:4'-phosphopantetheinyl transferase